MALTKSLQVLLFLGCCALLLSSVAEAKGKPKARNLTPYCGACKAVVDEIQYSVNKVSPHKTYQTGNFQVDSKGQQRGVKEKRYAGSEAHLIELLEKVCDLMQNYGETSDPDTGKKGYMRINSRDGEAITISNVNFSAGGSQDLTNACTYFLSDFEDDLIMLFQEGLSQKEIERELCHDITGYCTEASPRSEL